MGNIAVLLKGISDWQRGHRRPLLEALGFEPVGLRVPETGLPDFGLDASLSVGLEVAARRGAFYVLRINLSDGLGAETIRETARALYHHNPTRRVLLVFEARQDARLVFASWGLGPGPFKLSKLWIDTAAPRRSELDILAALSVGDQATTSEIALAHVRALDREVVTQRFFSDFRRHRAELAAGLTGLASTPGRDRLDLALILLGRLLFLYFVQGKGWLAGDSAYIRHLYEDSLDRRLPFYKKRLKPLFFGALNRPPGKRAPAARDLGELPFLNGGLFERIALERKYPRLDVPDACFSTLLPDLLEKYQFTLREAQSTDQDVAVDPEMLGRVFEGLMFGPLREATGCFFTPATLVERIVDNALSAYLASVSKGDTEKIVDLIAGRPAEIEPPLRSRLLGCLRTIRVIDPAVGSGAFLLAALLRLERARLTLEGEPPDRLGRFELRRQIIQRNLYGVDVNAAAVRLCELRLWLALSVDLDVPRIADVPPLPNLDLNIRQGDALLDPIDFTAQLGNLDAGGISALEWKREVRKLIARRERYFYAAGTGKRQRLRAIRQTECRLACRYIGRLIATIDARRGDLHAAACGRDLFGNRARLNRRQRKAATTLKRTRTELSRILRRIQDLDELPFFSFPVHFADPNTPDARFHVVLGNPPWVRTHHWSGLSRSRLKQRYHFLRNAGWRGGIRLAGAGRGFGAQADLSLLFLERGLELMRHGGALGFVLPSKILRCLAAGAARERLLRDTRILHLEDWSLATKRLFDATVYPLVLVVRREKPCLETAVDVQVHDRLGGTLDFRLAQADLPLLPVDRESPWVLAQPTVRQIFDQMRSVAPPLGALPSRRPSRGIFTGANSIFIGTPAGEHSSGTVAVDLPVGRTAIEREILRPALRGEDLAAWKFGITHVLIWPYDDAGRPLHTLPVATRDHLSRHRRLLTGRGDLRPTHPYWSLFRVRPEKLGLRVVWRDIAPEPGAVVVEPRVPFLGDSVPAVSLNTVYQIAAASAEDAYFMAAVLNSTVARAYLRAIAERASGGYFRFLGWTVALLPFPERPDAAATSQCVEIALTAHDAGGLDCDGHAALDEAVARLYGLGSRDLDALSAFDARFSSPSNAS